MLKKFTCVALFSLLLSISAFADTVLNVPSNQKSSTGSTWQSNDVNDWKSVSNPGKLNLYIQISVYDTTGMSENNDIIVYAGDVCNQGCIVHPGSVGVYTTNTDVQWHSVGTGSEWKGSSGTVTVVPIPEKKK